jgi:hypothetical protein
MQENDPGNTGVTPGGVHRYLGAAVAWLRRLWRGENAVEKRSDTGDGYRPRASTVPSVPPPDPTDEEGAMRTHPVASHPAIPCDPAVKEASEPDAPTARMASLPPEPTDEETAYHEAGHALVIHLSPALRLCGTLSIGSERNPDEYGGVGVCIDQEAARMLPADFVDREFAIGAAAGVAGHLIYIDNVGGVWNKQAAELGARKDLAAVRSLFGPGVFYDFACEARDRLTADGVWKLVERLAKTLLTERTMTAEQAEACINQPLHE